MQDEPITQEPQADESVATPEEQSTPTEEQSA